MYQLLPEAAILRIACNQAAETGLLFVVFFFLLFFVCWLVFRFFKWGSFLSPCFYRVFHHCGISYDNLPDLCCPVPDQNIAELCVHLTKASPAVSLHNLYKPGKQRRWERRISMLSLQRESRGYVIFSKAI